MGIDIQASQEVLFDAGGIVVNASRELLLSFRLLESGTVPIEGLKLNSDGAISIFSEGSGDCWNEGLSCSGTYRGEKEGNLAPLGVWKSKLFAAYGFTDCPTLHFPTNIQHEKNPAFRRGLWAKRRQDGPELLALSERREEEILYFRVSSAGK